VEGDGRRVAVLAYDPGAIEDPTLVDAVATAARLALVNARLRAHVAIGGTRRITRTLTVRRAGKWR
jgi:hypothetical protein